MMEKSTEFGENQVGGRIVAVAQALAAEVQFEEAPDGKLSPRVSVDEIISKFVALLVYGGATIGPLFLPNYNRVHADVEFWKKTISEIDKAKPTGNGEGC